MNDNPILKNKLPGFGKLGVPLLLILALASVLLWTYGTPPSEENEGVPPAYAYGRAIASNGMTLHFLRTRPADVQPAVVNDNVALSSYYGINGGFFYGTDLLSIAVVNDAPVNGEGGKYGNGGANVKYARGTLVWDGVSDKLGVQVVGSASEIDVADRSRYWAQGGISMNLGRDDLWAEQAAAEHAPFADEDRLRSAAAYDEEGNLYLIVSESKGSLASFREAVVERIGESRLVDGIFLDGDGSSQLRSREASLEGDGRPVVQMLRIMR